MPDLKFTFDWVPNTYAAAIQRATVLSAIRGYGKGRMHLPEQVRQQTEVLVRQWRARLHSLTTSGYSFVTSESSLQYTRNCAPTFVKAVPTTRVCKLFYLCPFCYARRVADIWTTVDAAFPNPRDVLTDVEVPFNSPAPLRSAPLPRRARATQADGERQLRAIDLGHSSGDTRVDFPYHLVVRVHDLYAPFLPPEQSTGHNYVTWVRSVMEITAARRRPLMDELRPRGAISMFTCVPVRQSWKVRTRDIYMIDKNVVLPENLPGQIRRIERPTRRRIFNALVWALWYPRQLLTGDVDMVAAMLQARRGTGTGGQKLIRLLETFGAFRGQTSEAH